MTQLLKEKQELREIIIAEAGQENFDQLIQERSKWIDSIRLQTQNLFETDPEEFREHVRFILANAEYSSEDEMFQEFMVTDIALDTIL